MNEPRDQHARKHRMARTYPAETSSAENNCYLISLNAENPGHSAVGIGEKSRWARHMQGLPLAVSSKENPNIANKLVTNITLQNSFGIV